MSRLQPAAAKILPFFRRPSISAILAVAEIGAPSAGGVAAGVNGGFAGSGFTGAAGFPNDDGNFGTSTAIGSIREPSVV